MRSYGALLLTCSPAQTFSEPLALGEIKAFLNLPERSPSDAAEDAMLEGFIAGAREVAEILQGRDLVRKQYDLYLDDFLYEIELRNPLVSVDLIRYRDSDGTYHDLTEDADYIVDTARAIVLPPYGRGFPAAAMWPSSAVLVRFTSGPGSADIFWSDAGQRLLIGMKELISSWYIGRLPFEVSASAIQEYPYTVTQLLTAGAVPRVR